MRWIFLCSVRWSNDAAAKTVGRRASVHFEVSAPFLREGRGMAVGEENSTEAEERAASRGCVGGSDHAPSITNSDHLHLWYRSIVLYFKKSWWRTIVEFTILATKPKYNKERPSGSGTLGFCSDSFTWSGAVRKIPWGHWTENIHPLMIGKRKCSNITFLQTIKDSTWTGDGTDLLNWCILCCRHGASLRKSLSRKANWL